MESDWQQFEVWVDGPAVRIRAATANGDPLVCTEEMAKKFADWILTAAKEAAERVPAHP